MEKITCGIVQDLFPSYSERLTGERVTRMMREHLENCRECQCEYEKFKQCQDEAEKAKLLKERKFGNKLKRIRSFAIGLLICAIVGAVALAVLLSICLMLVFFGGPAEITTDINQYGKTMAYYKNKTVRTKFAVFPEELPASAQNAEFYFYYKDTWNTPTCEVYLQCTYDAAEYRAEIERLENVQEWYEFVERPLLQDTEERFPYPTYIAVDGRGYAYEYALLSGENQITYIYTAFREITDLKKVDIDYLPVDFDSKPMQLDAGEGYYIYED